MKAPVAGRKFHRASVAIMLAGICFVVIWVAQEGRDATECYRNFLPTSTDLTNALLQNAIASHRTPTNATAATSNNTITAFGVAFEHRRQKPRCPNVYFAVYADDGERPTDYLVAYRNNSHRSAVESALASRPIAKFIISRQAIVAVIVVFLAKNCIRALLFFAKLTYTAIRHRQDASKVDRRAWVYLGTSAVIILLIGATFYIRWKGTDVDLSIGSGCELRIDACDAASIGGLDIASLAVSATWTGWGIFLWRKAGRLGADFEPILGHIKSAGTLSKKERRKLQKKKKQKFRQRRRESEESSSGGDDDKVGSEADDEADGGDEPPADAAADAAAVGDDGGADGLDDAMMGGGDQDNISDSQATVAVGTGWTDGEEVTGVEDSGSSWEDSLV